jgi:hypothetical protein
MTLFFPNLANLLGNSAALNLGTELSEFGSGSGINCSRSTTMRTKMALDIFQMLFIIWYIGV